MIRRVLVLAVLLLAVCNRHAEAACTISATGVSFGTYNVFATTDDTSTGTVTYRCTTFEILVQIQLSTGSSGVYTPNRTMKRVGENLNYNLYLDAAFTSLWGDNSGSTDQYTRFFPPTNTDINVTIYGRITALQDVTVGSYTDTVIATINF